MTEKPLLPTSRPVDSLAPAANKLFMHIVLQTVGWHPLSLRDCSRKFTQYYAMTMTWGSDTVRKQQEQGCSPRESGLEAESSPSTASTLTNKVPSHRTWAWWAEPGGGNTVHQELQTLEVLNQVQGPSRGSSQVRKRQDQRQDWKKPTTSERAIQKTSHLQHRSKVHPGDSARGSTRDRSTCLPLCLVFMLPHNQYCCSSGLHNFKRC